MTEQTCTRAAEAIRAGKLRPIDLVEHCLERIERFDAQVHAWVLVDAEDARREAAKLGDELSRGFDRGPLHGIPIGIKDIIDVAPWPTRAGSPLRADHRAARDAELVARLRRAGAIILGKTVTTEFAWVDPPPTRNPWNLDRTPGGSSSGSAAAVAMGMCLAAVGSQTGGSITRPASYCGVAGCKPAHGTVSVAGVFPFAPTLDHPGPVARTVDDLRLMLAAMVEQPWSPSPAEAGPPRLASGFPHFAGNPGQFPELTSVILAMRAQLGRITGSARSAMLMIPETFDTVVAMHRRIMAYEAGQTHREKFPSRRAEYGPKIAALLEEGLAITVAEYDAALAHRAEFRDALLDVLERVDAVVTVATPGPAPGPETTGDPRFNSPWSYAGVPTVSFPAALAVDGMPLALQLVGHPDRMDRLFAAARWCEERIAFKARPPLAV
ncbi:MAG TPA: amidase [Pirellulales bacterium]|jgi:aspartyl-tRNA(Asn)/glutamyl-tRNA(Gln) amidotransferase subunit A|nr:amidase [Pirellulales bacterium]